MGSVQRSGVDHRVDPVGSVAPGSSRCRSATRKSSGTAIAALQCTVAVIGNKSALKLKNLGTEVFSKEGFCQIKVNER